jgi:glycosyltransferase involved in cell wall biosynthesis
MSDAGSSRIPVLYLAPWVDFGGSDKNTIDWFRWIDRDRFAPSLITTQPSPNRLLREIEPFAEEAWVLSELMPAEDMPEFIFDFIHSRGVRVLHLMNSRLGFELLPDLDCLPNPPAVVVQMHAEEVDRSGYVRYVSTRHGHLVDRFSMSNRHVADAVEEYGVPAEKVRVIYTGADPGDEFSPDRAEPVAELPADRLQILFAARLVAQKDPLLMLDVAGALRDRGANFQIHVVGDGEMEAEIRERIAAEGLEEHVLLHPPMPGLQPWYAACDTLLMTSTFEGIPCVLFEAMAMGLPIVAPDLPAIGELLSEPGDTLISPRDSVEAYVAALAPLAEDRAHLQAEGARMRKRAQTQYTVRQMAEGHERLYEELLESRGGLATATPADLSDPPGLAIVSVADGPGLRGALLEAREPYLALTSSADPLLADQGLREKVLRRFLAMGNEVDAIALVDAGEEGRFTLRALAADEAAEEAPHTVIWARSVEEVLPRGLHADPAAPVASLTRLLAGAGLRVEWRHAPGEGDSPCGRPTESWEALAGAPSSSGDDPRAALASGLPGNGAYSVPRWEQEPTWVPAHCKIATRYRSEDGARLVASGPAPAGFEPEHRLGGLRSKDFVGTSPLVGPGSGQEIGHLELAGFPQMDPLALALHRETGQRVLVTVTEDDPLRDEVDLIEGIGYVEPVPARPRQTPVADRRPLGLIGLTRTLDHAARRHRYGVGEIPQGELVCELGALAESALQGDVAAWIVDGYLVTERHRPASRRPSPLAAARWAGEPARWRGLASPAARAKVSARRAMLGGQRLLRPPDLPADPSEDPIGWLYASERPRRTPLYAAYHPVTGDQLLTRSPEDAAQLGYDPPQLLGHMREVAPMTGDLQPRSLSIPWARRFGAVPLRG